MRNVTEQLANICSRVTAFIREAALRGPGQFEALAQAIFRFQYEHNPAYRAFCAHSGRSPDTVRDWTNIPAIVTSAFKDLELSVLAPSQRTTVFHSSGTTEQRRSRHFHSAATLEVYEASLIFGFKPNVLPDRDRIQLLILSPPASLAPHSSLAHMFTILSQEFGAEASFFVGQIAEDWSWVLNHKKLQAAMEALQASGAPTLICGTAFSFVHWCDALAARGARTQFPPDSRVFETGGYKGRSRTIPKAELHALIEKTLTIPQTHIFSEYGMSELSSQAYDRAGRADGPGRFQFPPWARARIISPENGCEVADGQTGLLRVYDLANVGSVLAVQTEDLAIRRGEGFELLGRAARAEARGCSLMETNS